VLVPVLVLIVWIGIYPQPFLRTTEASVRQLLAQVHLRGELRVTSHEPRLTSPAPDIAVTGNAIASTRAGRHGY